jgi:hypothetical protein
MKNVTYILFTLLMLLAFSNAGTAQSTRGGRGFDYAAHNQMNKKAGAWSKRRMKACRGDMANLKCNARQSRRYARAGK